MRARPFRGQPASQRCSPVLTFAVILVFCMPPSCLLGQAPTGAEAHARRGLAFAHSQQWALAEEELKQAVAAAPTVAIYHAQLASILGLNGNWDDSLLHFVKAVQLDPQNVGFRREAAAVQLRAGALDDAERNLRFVLKRLPHDPGATLLLGLVTAARGNYESAATLLSSQPDLVYAQPDRVVALFTSLLRSGRKADLGKVMDVMHSHANETQWANAISRCAAISAKDGDLDTTYLLYGLLPLEDKPDRQSAAFSLAVLLYHNGQVEQVQQLLQPLLSEGWKSADAERLLGNCLQLQHKNAAAIEAYSMALAIEPSNMEAYDNLISLEIDSGKASDALVVAKRAIEVAPNNAKAWVLKGNAELRLNAYKDALQSYRHANESDPSDPDYILLVGGVEFLAGQNDAAIADYQTGVKRFPADARFYIAYAEALLGEQDSTDVQTRAQTLLSKAIELAPASAEAHYQLGQIAMRQARLQDAEREFTSALTADPGRSKAHYAMSLVYRRMGRQEDAQKQFAQYQALKQAEESGPKNTLSSDTTP